MRISKPLNKLILLAMLCSLSHSLFAGNPADYRLLRDHAYGSHALQKMDVYIPENVSRAPVIVMVHGGGWLYGDKDNRAVVMDKVKRWVSRGFVFISVNYRLVPDADPLTQAEDVATAIAYAQNNAKSFDADPEQFVIMGHSAGAHLISLLHSDFEIAARQGARPWLGAVSIDTGGFDIEEIMRRNFVPGFYKRAFGNEPSYWKQASPTHRLRQKMTPMLAVCSTIRRDQPCLQAQSYAEKAAQLDRRVDVSPVSLSHRQTNSILGESNRYTEQVEAFLQQLSPAFAKRLKP